MRHAATKALDLRRCCGPITSPYSGWNPQPAIQTHGIDETGLRYAADPYPLLARPY